MKFTYHKRLPYNMLEKHRIYSNRSKSLFSIVGKERNLNG
jgi:hypothetical protein